ncbi:MAG: hypothetical protein JAY75_22615 [Candidatus Thiodiazotropha taylori]|nr:hypothetical protein [Candidatus Thiodiazotropha taylori]MCG8094217.1 hypothetical protein [Candidatus Thiodiazotropha endolucinida]MCG8033369.1 hypothetical protein [Candidatus Thiodiazotropha taylori]MCG8045652.1 hypothetical protein [Candidatus Thiodiazotropha taylori]MCG8079015.1 hypothetical protein [Candidatus Thiodiazotropha taylori]
MSWHDANLSPEFPLSGNFILYLGNKTRKFQKNYQCNLISKKTEQLAG